MLRLALTLLASGLLSASPAAAHKLKLFATAEGLTISGYAYFVPGGRAQDVPVTISADGKMVAQTQTDDEGRFQFAAKTCADQVIDVDAGDGHIAQFIVLADELPLSLTAGQGAVAPVTAPAKPQQVLDTDDTLRSLVEQSVARQIAPLRIQLDAYQERTTLHDVLGGLGYIFGLFGFYFWMSARSRRGAGK